LAPSKWPDGVPLAALGRVTTIQEVAVPTKRTFDLVIIMLLAWVPAKGLAKMVAARHAASDEGITRTIAHAAEVIL